MQNANNILTEVAKEEVIVITCMSSHYQTLLKKICLHKCIYSILNIDRKKDQTAKILILRDLEEIEEKSEEKNNLKKDKDQDQTIEKNRGREDILLPDHFLKIEGI